jgi:diguanylate cyclase (GGDEF)-like protein/PAS domain S-box-containing protein
MKLIQNLNTLNSLCFSDHTPGLFCSFSLDGQMIGANQEWHKYLGLSWTEIYGHQWLTKIHAEDVGAWHDYVISIPEGKGTFRRTMRLRHSDGKYRWLLWNANTDIANRQIMATIIDITEEKQAYSDLQESEQRLTRAIRGTKDGIWEWDLLTDEVYLSPRYKQLLGFAKDELANHKDSFFGRLHPDDFQRTWTVNEQHFRLGTPYEIEVRLLTKDNTYRWFLSRAQSERNADGIAIRQSGSLSDITVRKLAEQRQRESEQRLSFALEAAAIGDWNMDMTTNVAVRSIQHDRCFGYETPVKDWGYDTFLAHVAEVDRDFVDATFQSAMAGKGDYDVEFRAIWPDQSMRWLWSKGRFYFDDNGNPYRVAGIVMEITNKKSAEAFKKEQEGRYTLIFNNNLDGILQTTVDGTILAANPAACEILGVEAERLVTMQRQQFTFLDDARCIDFQRQVNERRKARSDLTLCRSDGSRFEADVSCAIYNDYSGRAVQSYVFRDISDRKRAEDEIHRLAFFDQLTGLGNRRYLIDRLTNLKATCRTNASSHSIIFIDLDHFKKVNDARGHAVGDDLLRLVARRIKCVLREQDTVARLGGDEFVVIGIHIPGKVDHARSDAVALGEKIRTVLDEPFLMDSFSYRLSCSIGITLMQGDGKSPDDLLREADTAMYRAKANGRNQILFFETGMHLAALDQLALESDLMHALSRRQLALHIQPQVDQNGAFVAGELLMRWMHPTRGSVPPSFFIPFAETSPNILALGDWVIEQGCNGIVRLAELGIPLKLSVNISPRQFCQEDFAAKVLSTLERTGAPATLLTLEVTEGVLIDDIHGSIRMMKTLASHGIRFSVDDFGTGYSSLSYISRLPLNEIKIDRSFVKNVPYQAEANALIQTIIFMAKNLQLEIVAEGVETQEQAEFLSSCGCDLLQGNFFAKPMHIEEWIASQRPGNVLSTFCRKVE